MRSCLHWASETLILVGSRSMLHVSLIVLHGPIKCMIAFLTDAMWARVKHAGSTATTLSGLTKNMYSLLYILIKRCCFK